MMGTPTAGRLRVLPFPQDRTVRENGALPHLEAGDVAEIDRIWAVQSARSDKNLFNGSVFDVTRVGEDAIEGCFSEYKLLVARRHSKDLRRRIPFLSLGVSGFLECADGIVIGRRSLDTGQDCGSWELVPSGGVDDTCRDGWGGLDLAAMIAGELEEEAGVAAAQVERMTPMFLLADSENDVLEAVFRIETRLTADEILAAHVGKASAEYSELRVIARRDMATEIAALDGPLVLVSQKILGREGLIALSDVDGL